MTTTTIAASLLALPTLARAAGMVLTPAQERWVLHCLRARLEDLGEDLTAPSHACPWWIRRWRWAVEDALATPGTPRGPRKIPLPPARLAVLLGEPVAGHPPWPPSPLSSAALSPPARPRRQRSPARSA